MQHSAVNRLAAAKKADSHKRQEWDSCASMPALDLAARGSFAEGAWTGSRTSAAA